MRRPLRCALVVVGVVAAAPAAAQYGFNDIRTLNCAQVDKRLQEGIDGGNAEAPYTAARLVAGGACFERSQDDYIALLVKSAERGHKPAMADLGFAFSTGEGRPQDYAKGGEWFRRSGMSTSGLDDYSLGFAAGLARVARRHSVETTRAWWNEEHRYAVELRFDPSKDGYEARLSRLGAVGDAAEAEQAERSLRSDLGDAWRKALRTLPAPDRTRLGAGSFAANWVAVIRPSSQRRARGVFDAEAEIPR